MDMIQIVVNTLFFIGGTIFTAGLVLFLKINWAIIKNKTALSAAFGAVAALTASGSAGFFNEQIPAGSNASIMKFAVLCILFVLFIATVLKSIVVDYFQPLSLSNVTCIFFIIGICTTIATSLLDLLLKINSSLSLFLPAGIVLSVLIGIFWAKTQAWSNFENINGEPLFLFVNGEAGYKTFRIPSLIVLDKEALNKTYGYNFANDVLLASAEARRNSSHDLGEIDIVGKLSGDGGKSWTKLNVLFHVENGIGKAGNPTPVFDKVNGVLNFVCTNGTKAGNYLVSTNNIQGVLHSDLTITWKDKILIGSSVPGPGKSIQLKSGRLVVPCGGHTLCSDDYGFTWKTGEMARGGESEALELSNGELMMVTRFGPGCSKYHPSQVQKISYSKDGGESWYMHCDTPLKTPMCQSSLDKTSDGTIYFSHPDCFLTRANLSVGISADNGKNWSVKRLYNGPSGYSCVAVDSKDTVYVLAEAGKVNYNEALIFLNIRK
ncbi:MAG: sialidase family protein [Eubacteriales bacterium]